MLEQIFGVPFTLGAFFLALSVVVFVHEFGHFIVARRCGVRCEAFSIGFGPELFGRTDKYGTRWKFSLIPLGGYVKMFGEGETMQVVEGGKTTEVVRELTPEERAISFRYKSLGQRAAIVFAGPAVNLLFAILVFWLTFSIGGRPVTDPVIGGVVEGGAAAEAGIQPGDRIVSIDGEPVARFEDIQTIVLLANGAPMRIGITRDGGQEQVFNVTPRVREEEDENGNVTKRMMLGIQASREHMSVVKLNPIDAAGTAVYQTYDVIRTTFVAVGQMIDGSRGTEDLGGPIRIAQISGQAAKTGVLGFILFMAILSINLGVVNLFPVPLLDGGHLMFYAIEAVRGRPLSEQVQEWGLRVGLALVLTLMLFVTWNDIVQLIRT
ncbi:MAG: RIP metalloprotease RseP [Rhodospirillaceae bacterium]